MNMQVDILAIIAKERQAQLRREAWQEQQLRQSAPRKEGWAMKQKFALALAAAALLAFAVAQVVTAAGSFGGGGGGPLRVM